MAASEMKIEPRLLSAPHVLLTRHSYGCTHCETLSKRSCNFISKSLEICQAQLPSSFSPPLAKSKDLQGRTNDASKKVNRPLITCNEVLSTLGKNTTLIAGEIACFQEKARKLMRFSVRDREKFH